MPATRWAACPTSSCAFSARPMAGSFRSRRCRRDAGGCGSRRLRSAALAARSRRSCDTPGGRTGPRRCRGRSGHDRTGVPGMHCAGCMARSNVRSGRAVAGVSEARVNLSARQVAWRSRSRRHHAALVDALTSVGFASQPRKGDTAARLPRRSSRCWRRWPSPASRHERHAAVGQRLVGRGRRDHARPVPLAFGR
jgi:hypothetical protein